MLILQFILTLIKSNPWKVFFLSICILSGYLMFNVESLKLESKIISKFEDGGKYHYIIKDGKSYSIKSYEKEVKSTDGKLHYEVIYSPCEVFMKMFPDRKSEIIEILQNQESNPPTTIYI